MENQSQQGGYQLDETIKHLPLEEKVPVVALKSLLDERHRAEEQKNLQISQINTRAINTGKVFSDRIAQIVQGSALTSEQLEYVLKNTGDKASTEQYGKGKRISGYWLKVLKNSKVKDLITQEDEKVLQHLQNIDFILKEQSISLIFQFSPANPYFEQQRLQRTMDLNDGEGIRTSGDLIKWKAGKCLTYEQKTVVNKKTGEKKVTNGEMKPSVFHFFRDANNLSEEQSKHLQVQEMIFNDLVFGVIPFSLQFYMDMYAETGQQGLIDDGIDEQSDEDEQDQPRKKQHK